MASKIERTESGQVYDHILREHQDMRRALLELTEGKADGMLKDLKDFITGHERAEEIVIYQELLKESDLKDLTMEMADEHHVADMVMAELEQLQEGSDEWKAMAKVFKEVVEQHLVEEESQYWPTVQMNKDDTWAEQLYDKFDEQHMKHMGDTNVQLRMR